MKIHDAIRQLNSYYVQTNKYEFCRFDLEGQKKIKITTYEDNFSVIFNDSLLYYGDIKDSPIEDLSPSGLLKFVDGRSKLTTKQKNLLKIPVIIKQTDLLETINYYKDDNNGADFSFASYLYNTPEMLAYYLVNISKHPYDPDEEASLTTKVCFVEYATDNNRNVSQNYYNVVKDIWTYSQEDILSFVSPDYVINEAVNKHPERFSKLKRIYNIDSALIEI